MHGTVMMTCTVTHSCGKVFCKTCCGYRRRLDQYAKPQPSGVWCDVCSKCFQQGQEQDFGMNVHGDGGDSAGQYRDLTLYFRRERDRERQKTVQKLKTRVELAAAIEVSVRCRDTVVMTQSGKKDLPVLKDPPAMFDHCRTCKYVQSCHISRQASVRSAQAQASLSYMRTCVLLGCE